MRCLRRATYSVLHASCHFQWQEHLAEVGIGVRPLARFAQPHIPRSYTWQSWLREKAVELRNIARLVVSPRLQKLMGIHPAFHFGGKVQSFIIVLPSPMWALRKQSDPLAPIRVTIPRTSFSLHHPTSQPSPRYGTTPTHTSTTTE